MDGVEIAPSSLADLRQLGEAYRAGDKALQKRVRTALQDAGKQLASDVPRLGAEKMPQRGGLAARIAAARGGVTVSLSSSRVSVSIRAKTREGYALRKINQGIVRHPVFGEKRLKLSKEGSLGSAWVAQKVPENAFTDAFEKESPKTKEAVRAAVQKALQDIAGDAS